MFSYGTYVAHNALHLFQNFSCDGSRLVFSCKVKSSLSTNLMAHLLGAYPSFCGMKCDWGIATPLWIGCQSITGYPQPIKFAGTHLYTWLERGTVRVKCPAQEHIAMPLARAQSRNTRSGMRPPTAHRCCNDCIKQMPKH